MIASKARVPVIIIHTLYHVHTFAEQKMEVVRGGSPSPPPPPPPPIIFERRSWPQQTIYYWKGNVMASRIHFKYWKKYFDFATLWEIFAKWLCKDSAMAPEKISNFQNMNILYIALKQVIWRFPICNYFWEISKFRDFMNTLRNFAKSVFAHISAKQFILTESPDHVL